MFCQRESEPVVRYDSLPEGRGFEPTVRFRDRRRLNVQAHREFEFPSLRQSEFEPPVPMGLLYWQNVHSSHFLVRSEIETEREFTTDRWLHIRAGVNLGCTENPKGAPWVRTPFPPPTRQCEPPVSFSFVGWFRSPTILYGLLARYPSKPGKLAHRMVFSAPAEQSADRRSLKGNFGAPKE